MLKQLDHPEFCTVNAHSVDRLGNLKTQVSNEVYLMQLSSSSKKTPALCWSTTQR